MASTTPQKKRGLSSLFGAKKSKDNKDLAPMPPIGANHDLHASTSTAGTAPQPDSAYASSNHPSSKRNSVANLPHAESSTNADVVPVENTGNIEGVGPERNIAYNTSTGQVVDDDTGQVIVTTTTTTTTTMSTRGGKKDTKVEVHTKKDEQQPAIAEAPGDMPSMSSTTSHSPAPPLRNSSSNIRHPSFGSPSPYNNGAPQLVAPTRPDPDHFPVPARNPMREREPMDPVSPLRPNFSYPSRTDIREDPMPAPAPKSTFANLKAAAQGLHGVGETVRGTLNNEIDSRFPRSNSQKAAAANAKNQAVLAEGEREMARVSMRRSVDYRRSQDYRYSQDVPPPLSPVHSQPALHEPMPQQLVPGPPLPNHLPPQRQTFGIPPSHLPPLQQTTSGPPPNHLPQFSPPPQSEPTNSSSGGFSSYGGGSGSSTEMSQMPPSFSPESSAPEQKKGGFRKLIKRRPVGPA